MKKIKNGQTTKLRVKRFLCHDIKGSLQETGYAGVEWINVTRDMGARETILNTSEHQKFLKRVKGMCPNIFLNDDLN